MYRDTPKLSDLIPSSSKQWRLWTRNHSKIKLKGLSLNVWMVNRESLRWTVLGHVHQSIEASLGLACLDVESSTIAVGNSMLWKNIFSPCFYSSPKKYIFGKEIEIKNFARGNSFVMMYDERVSFIKMIDLVKNTLEAN